MSEDTNNTPPSTNDLSVEALTDLLEKKISEKIDETLKQLQSLSQDKTGQTDNLKQETHKILNLYQMRLLTRTLSILINPTDEQRAAKTSAVLAEVKQVAQHLQELLAGEAVREINAKAAAIQQQITMKEQAIKEQIAQRQKELADIFNKIMPKANSS